MDTEQIKKDIEDAKDGIRKIVRQLSMLHPSFSFYVEIGSIQTNCGSFPTVTITATLKP